MHKPMILNDSLNGQAWHVILKIRGRPFDIEEDIEDFFRLKYLFYNFNG